MKKPDQDDIKKLSQTVQYLWFTQHMSLTLEADELNEAKWCVDASFVTHCDMRSHTVGIMSLERDYICIIQETEDKYQELNRSGACGDQ